MFHKLIMQPANMESLSNSTWESWIQISSTTWNRMCHPSAWIKSVLSGATLEHLMSQCMIQFDFSSFETTHIIICFHYGCSIPFLAPSVRSSIHAVEQRKLRATQEHERNLAEKVQMATVEQLRHKFNQDMQALRGRIPDQNQIAKNAALDKKYLSDRQKMHSSYGSISFAS